MRGNTSDRVVEAERATGAAASDLAAAAGTAVTLVDVQRLVARLRGLPGVRSALLGAAGVPVAGVPVAGDRGMEARLPVGLPEWRLELRIALADAAARDRVEPVARGIAAAADRALSQPCDPLVGAPSEAPPPLYRAITQGARAVILAVDPAGGWFPLSDAFTQVLGYDRLSPPAGRLIDLVHPEDRPAAMDTFATACAGIHPPGPVDLRVRTADGGWRTLEAVTRSFVDDSQVGVVAYFALDVTAQRIAERAAESERERLTTLVETLPDGILLLDADGRIELINDASRRLLGLTAAGGGPGLGSGRASGGRSWDELLETLDALSHGGGSAVGRLRQAITADRAVVGEEIEFSTGPVVELDVVPVRTHGRRLSTLVHVRDVTARVATRRGLEERSRGLEERNRSLAEATALNNEFVATVAHELRGPLSSVVAFSHLLGDAASGELSGDQRTYLDVIDRNTNRLLRLIEDLLLLSRLEARTLRLHPTLVQLPELLAAAVAERTPAAAANGIMLSCEVAPGPALVCDDTRIHQVVDNLISNALKFTPNGGRVSVRARPEADMWMIEVADSGIGIPAGDVSRLFRAFFRGASPPTWSGRQAPPGTGLGLVVSRAIAELHGGTIGVASTEGVGTTVTLSLPTEPLKKDGG